MKNFTRLSLLFIAVAAITITSCKEDDGDTTPALTAEQKLAGNTFLITDQTITENDTIIQSFDDLDACDKDDLLIFNADKTGSFDEGVSKCDPNDPQSESMTWDLVSETRLKVTDAFLTDTFDIVTNDGTNLKLELRDDDNGDIFVISVSYVKQ